MLGEVIYWLFVAIAVLFTLTLWVFMLGDALGKRGIDPAMYLSYLASRERRALIGVQVRLAALRYLARRIGRVEGQLAAKARDEGAGPEAEASQGRSRATGPGS